MCFSDTCTATVLQVEEHIIAGAVQGQHAASGGVEPAGISLGRISKMSSQLVSHGTVGSMERRSLSDASNVAVG